MDNSWLQLTPSSKKKQRVQKSNVTSDYASPEHKLSYELPHISSIIYETPNKSLETLVKQSLQTRQVREELQNNWNHLDKNT